MHPKTLALSALALLLSACHDSEPDINELAPSIKTETGVFIDSPVSGLEYQTLTQSGVTDSNGQFTYVDGEQITFSFGDIIVGSSLARDVMTPLTLSGSFSTEEDRTLNVVRFLLSLDSDEDASNGISLTQAQREAASFNIDFNVPVGDFENQPDLQAAIAELAPSGTLTPADTAKEHIETTLTGLSYTYGGFVGSWEVAIDAPEYREIYAFLSNGEYIAINLFLGQNTDATSLEWGSYGVDRLERTEFFSDTVFIDQNGEDGLSSTRTTEQIGQETGVRLELSNPSDNELLFDLTLIIDGIKAGEIDFIASRLNETGLSGTWLNPSVDDGQLDMILLVDNHYFHLNVETSSEISDAGTTGGLEYGSFANNEGNLELTVISQNHDRESTFAAMVSGSTLVFGDELLLLTMPDGTELKYVKHR